MNTEREADFRLPSLMRQNSPAATKRTGRRTPPPGYDRQNSPSVLRQNGPSVTYLEIELWRGSVKIEDWTVSGEGFIDFSKTASVAKGNTYTLKVYAEINNVEITPVSLTKTYR